MALRIGAATPEVFREISQALLGDQPPDSGFPLLLYLLLRTFQSHPHSFLCLPCNLETLLKQWELLEDSLLTLNSAWTFYYSWTNTECCKGHPQLYKMYYIVWLYSSHYTLILPLWILLSIQLVGVLFSQYTEF